MQDVDKAMRITGNKSKNADSQLWSSMMRFYDQVLVSMSMPSVISDIEKQLADGKACVVQVVNTQEAAQERAVEKMRADGSEDYDNLFIKGINLGLLRNIVRLSPRTAISEPKINSR